MIARAELAPRFEAVPGSYLRIAVGEPVEGWLRYADSAVSDAPFEPDGPTRADDPLLLYFTSGTTALPKLVEHTHVSYPIGHLSTMYWIGLQPGDVHLNVSSPGWAKHAWSCVFAPWLAGATICLYNYERFDAAAMLDTLRDAAGDDVLRAADGVAHADPAGSRRVEGRPVAARARRRGRAAQPRGDRVGTAGVGPHHPRRLRADRDLAADRQLARASRSRSVRWAGRCPASTSRSSIRSPARSATRARSAWSPSPERPVGLMVGYRGDDERNDGRLRRRALSHRRRRAAATPTATSPTSAAPTTCSRPATTGSARSSSRAC